MEQTNPCIITWSQFGLIWCSFVSMVFFIPYQVLRTYLTHHKTFLFLGNRNSTKLNIQEISLQLYYFLYIELNLSYKLCLSYLFDRLSIPCNVVYVWQIKVPKYLPCFNLYEMVQYLYQKLHFHAWMKILIYY